jgi:hypothetical protein
MRTLLYLLSIAWLILCAMSYGVFLWMAILLAPMGEQPGWLFVTGVAGQYLFILVMGVGPLIALKSRHDI